MSRFNVRYYAMLREAAGRTSEEVQSDAPTSTELYAELAGRYGFIMTPAYLKVSINDEISEWDRPLNNGDRVAFMPPFAGG